MIYLCGIDGDGKITIGTSVAYPAEYTNQCTQEVFENADRAQYINDAWVIHDPLTATAPATATVGEAINVSVTLPAESPDTSINAQVSSDGTQTDLGAFDVVSGQATVPLNFETPGTYQITVSSRFHGAQTVSVVVS